MSTTQSPLRIGTRIEAHFDRALREGAKTFVSYMMASDPDFDTSLAIMRGLPEAGVDIIELGMPFTDPMADGPTIQAAGQRALAAGGGVKQTLAMVSAFRENDDITPIVLMGYYNPIYAGDGGVEGFLSRAKAAGVDGLIIVDLPPEEDHELCIPAQNAGLNFIRLATPTTDDKRLPAVAANTSGFIYYVSITGITGTAQASAADLAPDIARIREATGLPVVIGFGISTAENAKSMAEVADGCVVGSAIVRHIGEGKSVEHVLDVVRDISSGAHAANNG